MKFYAPKNLTSISFNGQHYDIDSDGSVKLPANELGHLVAHGLSAEPQFDVEKTPVEETVDEIVVKKPIPKRSFTVKKDSK
jgi:hypothetical protein